MPHRILLLAAALVALTLGSPDAKAQSESWSSFVTNAPTLALPCLSSDYMPVVRGNLTYHIAATTACGSGGGGVSGPGSSISGYVPQWSGTGGNALSGGLPVGLSGVSTIVETNGSGLIANALISGLPSSSLSSTITAGTCNNCNLTYDLAGRITVAGNGSSSGVSITGGDASIVASPSPLTGTGTITVGGPSHLTTFTANAVPIGAGSSPFSAVGPTASSLMGWNASGVGSVITLGTNLSMSGSTLNASGGGGSLTLTDGTHTVTPTTQITVTGGTVGGTTPNATLTITGGSGTVTNIATAAPLSGGPCTTTCTVSLTGPSNLTTFAANAVPVGANTSPFAAIGPPSSGLGVLFGWNTSNAASQIVLGTNLSMTGNTLNASSSASTLFSALTTSTNTTAAMLVGTGASLGPTGSGVVIANQVPVALGAGSVCSNSSGVLSAPSSCPIVPTIISTSTVALVAANAGQLVLATNASPTTITLAQSTGALGTGFGIDAFTEPSTSILNVTTSTLNGLHTIKLGSYQDIAIAADGAGQYVGSLSVPQPATQTHTSVLYDDMVWAAPPAGTVTSITCGTGLSGGTITTSGTCSLANVSAVSHQFFTSIVSNTPVLAQPAFTDISGQTTLAQLPTLSANTVLGALTATTPSGLALPSCVDTSGNHLNWTSGTGFSCGTTSSGGASTTLNQITTGTSNTLASITTTFTSEVWISATTGAKTDNVPGCVSGLNKDFLIEVDGQQTAGTYPITVTPASGTIGPNGTATYTIASNANGVVFQCDGTSTTWRLEAASVPGTSVRYASGTTLTVGANDNGNVISQNNASAVAATIAAANTAGFPEGGYQTILQNTGAGTVTLTPTTSTITSATCNTGTAPNCTSITIAQGGGELIFADLSGNYVGIPVGGSGGGSGVTSVGLTVPATSIFGVTGSPVTTSGTLGLTTTVTSGGILYGSSTTQVASSGVQTANALIKGGGAATAPSPSKVSDNGTLTGINYNATALPTAQTGTILQVASPDGVANRIEQDAFGATAHTSAVCFGGTNASPTAVTAGTVCGSFNAFLYNGSAQVGPLASVRMFANENQAVSGTHGGTYVDILATPNGSTTPVSQVQIVPSAGGSGGGGGAGVNFALGTSHTPFALTDASTIAVDASKASIFTLTLTGNHTLGFPTNLPTTNQQYLLFRVTQDGTGGRTLAFGSGYTGTIGLNSGAGQETDFMCTSSSASAATCVGGAAIVSSTASNCSNGASPAVCGSARGGSVAVPTGVNPTLVINTTAVTSISQVLLTIDESATIASTTCNTTLATLIQPVVTARTAGTSFTIQIPATLATNPACVDYLVIN